jgi:hypothetical protein
MVVEKADVGTRRDFGTDKVQKANSVPDSRLRQRRTGGQSILIAHPTGMEETQS